jgi:acyl carrier protein
MIDKNLIDLIKKLEQFFEIKLEEEKLPEWNVLKFIAIFYDYTYKKLNSQIKQLFK